MLGEVLLWCVRCCSVFLLGGGLGGPGGSRGCCPTHVCCCGDASCRHWGSGTPAECAHVRICAHSAQHALCSAAAAGHVPKSAACCPPQHGSAGAGSCSTHTILLPLPLQGQHLPGRGRCEGGARPPQVSLLCRYQEGGGRLCCPGRCVAQGRAGRGDRPGAVQLHCRGGCWRGGWCVQLRDVQCFWLRGVGQGCWVVLCCACRGCCG